MLRINLHVFRVLPYSLVSYFDVAYIPPNIPDLSRRYSFWENLRSVCFARLIVTVGKLHRVSRLQTGRNLHRAETTRHSVQPLWPLRH